MTYYEIACILSTPLFIYSVYLLFHTYLGENVYNREIEYISYLSYGLTFSLVTITCKVPILKLLFSLSCFFLISLNYKSSVQKRILTVFLICSMFLIIEITIMTLLGSSTIHFFDNNDFELIIGLIIIRIVDMIFAYLIRKHNILRQKNYTISKIYYIAFIIILFGTLFLFISSLEKNNLKYYNVIFNGSILMIVNITMIIIDEKMYESINNTKEKAILQQQNIAYENQVKIMEESFKKIRSLKHDIKNHIIVLDALYKENKSNEIETYIKEILDNMEGSVLSKSNNFVIDSIINLKLQNLTDYKTNINLNINIPKTLSISAYDITVIMGNLLDNAITAIEKSIDKFLNLQISYNMGNLVIFIDNSFDGNIIEENDKLKTTKSCKNAHGIGIDNIQKTIEKYGGEMQIEYNNNIFSVTIIIPCTT